MSIRHSILVGSALNEKPGGPASIYLKGVASEATRAIIASADTEINIVDGQPYSFDELQKRAWAAHDTFMKAGYTDVVTAPDTTTGKITVELGPHPAGLSKTSTVLESMPPILPTTSASQPYTGTYDLTHKEQHTGSWGDVETVRTK